MFWTVKFFHFHEDSFFTTLTASFFLNFLYQERSPIVFSSWNMSSKASFSSFRRMNNFATQIHRQENILVFCRHSSTISATVGDPDYEPPFEKVMAANRGEIATRILRAGSELGMQTVAIFSHEDRFTQHRYKADQAFVVGNIGL